MTDDIEKLHLIHRLKNGFSVDETTVQQLIRQVDPSKAQYAERFFSGYTVENRFGVLYGLLPWVALIHGLEQHQIPESSKAHFQVPDYTALYKSVGKPQSAVLVDVKHASCEKQTLELMIKQHNAIQAYADACGLMYLVAIYWNKMRMWTLNAPDVFEVKTKKIKIGFENAVMTDLSVVMGDLTYIIPSLYRSSQFDSELTDPLFPNHEKYGTMVTDLVGLNKDNLFPLKPIESAVIDSYINVREKSISRDGNKTQITEEAENPYVVKLSTLIMHFLSSFSANPTQQNATLACAIITGLMKKLGVTVSHGIPAKRSKIIDDMMRSAFEGTWLWEHYCQLLSQNQL